MKINDVEFEKKEIEIIKETLSDYMTYLCNRVQEEEEDFGDSEYLEILNCRLAKVSHVSAKFLKAIK